MSNELKKIVKGIQFRTDKTIEEIAKEIGYARAYFTNQVNIGTNKKLKELLLEKFPLTNEQNVPPAAQTDEAEQPTSQVNEDPTIYNMVLPMADLVVTLKDYVTLLIETKNKAEEREKRLLALLEKDMSTLKTNSETIQADLSQVARMVRADDLTTMDSLDRIEGREAGTASTEASIVERAFAEEDQDTDTNTTRDTGDNSGIVKQKGKA